MDQLTLAIRNLSKPEKNYLVKRLQSQKQKLKLFNVIDKKGIEDNNELAQQLKYGENFTRLYTLKNRLFDDIVDVKLEAKKNTYVLLKEKIQNLRNLVYSKDKVSLLRELKKLEKNAEAVEIYDELKEIHFCSLLSHRHERKKAEELKAKMDACAEKQKLLDETEQIFYLYLLDTQDLFYFNCPQEFTRAELYLAELERLSEKLDSSCSKFLYLSAKLTLYLNNPDFLTKYKDAEAELNELYYLYTSTFLPYKYPNCHIAIHCLFGKLYFFQNRVEEFLEVQNYIMDKVDSVNGYQMFDCSLFNFIFMNLIHQMNTGNADQVPQIIEDYVRDEDIEQKDEKMRNYYLYLQAVKNYYNKDYDSCLSYLMQSRDHFSELITQSSWAALDNVLLSIIINVKTKDFNFANSEISYLKRQLKKFDLDEDFQNCMKGLSKGIKKVETGQDSSELISALDHIKEKLALLRLVDYSDL